MTIYIPCLNPDVHNKYLSSGIQIVTKESALAGAVSLSGSAVSVVIGEAVFYLTPVSAIIAAAINYQMWANLFGLGETRIDREKATIQAVMTSIFRYLNVTYGVPIRDNHALNFPSDGVRAQFLRRPDIAALVPAAMQSVGVIASLVFASRDTSQGEKERVVNQFLANAAYNDWPVAATIQIWEGLYDATNPNCSQDLSRWTQDPLIILESAKAAAVLQYIPLSVLVAYAARNAIGTYLGANQILTWAANPALVANLPKGKVNEWSPLYQTFEGSYLAEQDEFGNVIPLYGRSGIGALVNSIVVKTPRYPDFVWPNQQLPTPTPQPQPPGPTPQPQPPSPTPTPQPPSPTPTPQPTPTPTPQPTPTPTPQPTTPPVDQPPIIPPREQNNTQPTQTDYDLGCQITRKMANRTTLTQRELDWMLTVVGSMAVTWAVNNPQCGYTGRQGTNPPPVQDNPHCPPAQPPTYQPPYPQPQPQPLPPTQRDGHCDPDCQVQIDLVKQKQQECCDEITTYVIPTLDNHEQWLRDVERRLPGPRPALPDPPPLPRPAVPVDPLPPYQEPPDEPPTTTPPTHLPPEVVQCLMTYCEGEVHQPPGDETKVLAWAIGVLCECGKKAREKPKKWLLNACEFGTKAWGIMAECWLTANTEAPPDEWGLPDFIANPVVIEDAMTRFLLGDHGTIYEMPLAYADALITQGLDSQAPAPVWSVPDEPMPFTTIFTEPGEDETIEMQVV